MVHHGHTTGTVLENVQIDDEGKGRVQQYLAMRHELGRDESPSASWTWALSASSGQIKGILKTSANPEINACTVKIKCDVNGEEQDWLYLQKRNPQPPRKSALRRRGNRVGGPIRDPCPATATSTRQCVTGAAGTGSGVETLEVSCHSASWSPPQQPATLPTATKSARNRPGQRVVPSATPRSYGDRRRRGRSPGRCVRRETHPGDIVVLLAAHRPRWHRRRNAFQSAQP
ncbi:MAG: hypothetical protein ACLRX5_09540 [Slackia sp.]